MGAGGPVTRDKGRRTKLHRDSPAPPQTQIKWWPRDPGHCRTRVGRDHAKGGRRREPSHRPSIRALGRGIRLQKLLERSALPGRGGRRSPRIFQNVLLPSPTPPRGLQERPGRRRTRFSSRLTPPKPPPPAPALAEPRPVLSHRPPRCPREPRPEVQGPTWQRPGPARPPRAAAPAAAPGRRTPPSQAAAAAPRRPPSPSPAPQRRTPRRHEDERPHDGAPRPTARKDTAALP